MIHWLRLATRLFGKVSSQWNMARAGTSTCGLWHIPSTTTEVSCNKELKTHRAKNMYQVPLKRERLSTLGLEH